MEIILREKKIRRITFHPVDIGDYNEPWAQKNEIVGSVSIDKANIYFFHYFDSILGAVFFFWFPWIFYVLVSMAKHSIRFNTFCEHSFYCWLRGTKTKICAYDADVFSELIALHRGFDCMRACVYMCVRCFEERSNSTEIDAERAIMWGWGGRQLKSIYMRNCRNYFRFWYFIYPAIVRNWIETSSNSLACSRSIFQSIFRY